MKHANSVNWRIIWRRFIWTSIFGAMMALLILMSKDMADSQPVIFGIVILAAIVGSVGFVYARENRAALVVAILAISVHSFLEASYWASVIEDINGQVNREQAATEARALVAEKRKQRYGNSAIGKSADQISAEIEAKRQNERWASSNKCSNATATASREFCADYFRLVADLAAAKEAASLESVVWTGSTNVEVPDIKRNLAKGAMLFADLTGKSVRDATNVLVIILVLFTQAVLAFALFIGYAPEDRREARTAANPSAGMTIATRAVLPVQPRTALPDPTPPGNAAPVETPTPVEAAPARPRLVDENWTPPAKVKPAKPTKAQKEAAIDAIVSQWLATGRTVRVAIDKGNRGIEIYKAYADFCAQQTPPLNPANPSHFGRSLRRLNVAWGKRASGVHYGLKLIKAPVRRVA